MCTLCLLIEIIAYSYPEVTYSYPRVTYSDPMVTYSDPKVTHCDPTLLLLPLPTSPDCPIISLILEI